MAFSVHQDANRRGKNGDCSFSKTSKRTKQLIGSLVQVMQPAVVAEIHLEYSRKTMLLANFVVFDLSYFRCERENQW